MTQVPPTATVPLAVQVVMPVLTVKGPVTDTAGFFKVSTAVLLLVRVTLVGPLMVPRGVAAKATELGFRTIRLVPVPVIPTTCGLLGSLSLMTSAPFFGPVVFG